MKNKLAWSVIGCLVVIALVMGGCGTTQIVTTGTTSTTTATTTSTTTTTATTEVSTASTSPGTVTINLTKLDGTVIEKQVEEPQYGGILNTTVDVDISGLDPTHQLSNGTLTALGIFMEQLGHADWTRGPAGTEELSWGISGIEVPSLKYMTGCLAESWEQVDPTTIVVKLREEIYWQNKAPANGREVVADDVVYCFDRWKASPKSDKQYVQYIDSVTATGDYTVTFKMNAPQVQELQGILCGRGLYIYPHEIIDQYGEEALSDWKNVVGSGPFILDDAVINSTYSFVKNPGYWGYDELFPENQLPYLDGVRLIIIPESSVQQSALRSGKVDILSEVSWNDSATLIQTSSELKYVKRVATRSTFVDFITNPGWGELDTTSPFSDIRVRQALCMSIDREEIVSGFLKGNGEAYNWPFMQYDDADNYIPLDQLPESTQEQFTYDPEMAKQLLADAGYSDLEISPIVNSSKKGVSERSELIASYWTKIGIKVNLQLLDNTSFTGRWNSGNLEGLVFDYSGASTTSGCVSNFASGGGHKNYGNSDPVLDQIYSDASTEWDPALADQKWQQAGMQLLSNCWVFSFPAEMKYNFWTPRVQNYDGLKCLNKWNYGPMYKHIWLQE